jgi:hypothetical protein
MGEGVDHGGKFLDAPDAAPSQDRAEVIETGAEHAVFARGEDGNSPCGAHLSDSTSRDTTEAQSTAVLPTGDVSRGWCRIFGP